MSKANQWRDQSSEELESAYLDRCRQIHEMRNGFVGIGDAPKVGELRKARKDIARIRTVMRERELAVSPKQSKR